MHQKFDRYNSNNGNPLNNSLGVRFKIKQDVKLNNFPESIAKRQSTKILMSTINVRKYETLF